MTTINVDFDVYTSLRVPGDSESGTSRDVIRGLPGPNARRGIDTIQNFLTHLRK
jgi:hypothetical protein